MMRTTLSLLILRKIYRVFVRAGYDALCEIAETEQVKRLLECIGYATFDDGGNVIYVYLKKELVVGITSSFKPRAKYRIELI